MYIVYFTFADDTVLVYTHQNPQLLEELINTDLNRYCDWLKCNKLSINIKKTVFMILAQKNKAVLNINLNINGNVLEQVKKYKYLGIEIDSKLEWTEHIKSLANKIIPLCGALKRTSNMFPRYLKRKIYFAIIEPHLRYGITTWGLASKQGINKVSVIQNRLLKILFELPWLTPTDRLYKNLKILPVQKLIYQEQCKLMYKIIHKLQKTNYKWVSNEVVHRYDTRIKADLHVKTAKTGKGQTVIYKSAIAYNDLPQNIKMSSSFSMFSNKIAKYLNDVF